MLCLRLPSSARSGAPGLAYTQNQLLPITLKTPQSGRTFALNPYLGGVQNLYNAGRAAIIANTGTLRVVADVDGVVIVAGSRLDEVLTAGRARADKEIGFFEALRNGATTVELLGLDASLVRVETPED